MCLQRATAEEAPDGGGERTRRRDDGKTRGVAMYASTWGREGLPLRERRKRVVEEERKKSDVGSIGNVLCSVT
jgi:hypothetical protein